jgi:hypothetical protein
MMMKFYNFKHPSKNPLYYMAFYKHNMYTAVVYNYRGIKGIRSYKPCAHSNKRIKS